MTRWRGRNIPSKRQRFGDQAPYQAAADAERKRKEEEAEKAKQNATSNIAKCPYCMRELGVGNQCPICND